MKLKDELEALEKAAVDVRKHHQQGLLDRIKPDIPEELHHVLDAYEKPRAE